MNKHPSHTHITIDMSMNSSTELSHNEETIEYLRSAQESDNDISPRETNSDTSPKIQKQRKARLSDNTNDKNTEDFWEANSESDEEYDIDEEEEEKRRRLSVGIRYRNDDENFIQNEEEYDDYNLSNINETTHGVKIYSNNNNNTTHNRNNRKFKKLRYEDLKKKLSNHYEQSIVNKYSSAFDILVSYVKFHCFLFHEASDYCNFRLNVLMLPSILLTSMCTVLSGILECDETGKIIISIANAMVTFILAIINYLKLDACSEAHKISCSQYNKIKSYLEFTSGEVLLFQNSLLQTGGVSDEMTRWKYVNKNLLYHDKEQYFDEKYKKLNSLYEQREILEKDLGESLHKKIIEVKRMLKDIKDNNRFIIPKPIINDYSLIYNINIFTFLKNIDNHRMTLLTELKNICNEIRFLMNKERTDEENEHVKELYNIKNTKLKTLLELNNGYRLLDKMFQKVMTNVSLKRRYWIRFLIYDVTSCCCDFKCILPRDYTDPYCDDNIGDAEIKDLLKKLL